MTTRIPESVPTIWTIVTINAMPPQDPNDEEDDRDEDEDDDEESDDEPQSLENPTNSPPLAKIR
jgi:hypothetical protein